MDSRITMHRRRFAEVVSQKPHITFTELKKLFVTKKEGMNLATLYRIIDAFKLQGLIHEIELGGERVIFLCHCMDRAETEKGIIITACTNCLSIVDNHFALEAPVTDSTTIQYVRSCGNCVLR